MNQTTIKSTGKNRLSLIMSIACGLTAANLYYSQPMLANMSQSFGVSEDRMGLIPMATQIGVSMGLLILVPLGDQMNRKRLILHLMPLLIAALGVSALAPKLWILAVASLATGMFSTIPQQLIPYAVQLVPEGKQGKSVGTLMAGLLTGILMSRTISGWVSELLNWRWMYAVAAIIMLLQWVMLGSRLPATTPVAATTYRKLLYSMTELFRGHALLRVSCLIGGLLFASFGLFWTVLTFWLTSPAFGLSPGSIGLFGLVGISGILVAPMAGRLADQGKARLVLIVATGSVISAFLVCLFWGNSVAGLVISIILLDIGIQAALIANQKRIFALDNGARSRINTIFMTCYFIGGAAGSVSGSTLWKHAGWVSTSLLGIVFAASALVFLIRFERTQESGYPKNIGINPSKGWYKSQWLKRNSLKN